MIETLFVLIGALAVLFFVAFFFLSKDLFKSGALKVKKAKVKHKEPFYVLFAAWLITMVIIAGEFVRAPPGITVWTWLGVLIFVWGGLIRIRAKKQLHRFFSFHVVIQQGHKLVKKGLYEKVRHPLIAGDLLMIIGLAVMIQSVYGTLLIIVALIPASLYYISQEEKALIDEFKDEYLTYMKQTKKLIPGMY